MRPKIENFRSFNLYGKPFAVPKGEEKVFIIMIHQIIGLNQYHVELIGKGGAIADVGANIGVFSVFAAVNNADSIVYSFEPTPSTFEILKENTKYYPNIRIFNCGLGEKEKNAFIVTANHSASNYVGESGIPINIKTMDSFDFPAKFIKIDAEGYESNILNGATKTIKENKPVIVMSAYHKPDDKTELPKTLGNIAHYDCEFRSDCEEDLVCKPTL